ncbi:RimJ/RimL family protein N-acetyltransferase [Nocardioides luteus]|uniref:N-acetyltransferase n=1 Tax=Nocardioides luteus TaxID=1844 RepID=A0ABQ5SS80_9ACTN|nr:GNAT family N-acetyltransferase [Nocardioides luteus]MDR7311120.1 RimJ/RimL family protein N-acetyltransferase [Nocardioides luteus]GGR62421.1 N-acetyltransferase [Nocardioides luteus]GLJ66666.1 N-acetyltransferase [Nocardioides luteus]
MIDTRPDPLVKAGWPLHTERLTIRRMVAADIEPTWAFRGLPEVAEWVTTAFTDLESYRRVFEHPDVIGPALVIEHHGVIIGDLMLRITDPWSQTEVREQAIGSQAELGWTIDPAHQGKGYATEAVRAVLDVCFGPLGLRRVVAECFADNEPSWRLMERLGMRRESHTRKDSLHRTRGWLDGMSYAILAEEWPVTR